MSATYSVGPYPGIQAINPSPHRGADIAGIAATPKELGYIQRIEGINDGLAAIEGRLIDFAARIQGNDGHPIPGNPAGASLSDSLAAAEQRVRNILQTINGLNESF